MYLLHHQDQLSYKLQIVDFKAVYARARKAVSLAHKNYLTDPSCAVKYVLRLSDPFAVRGSVTARNRSAVTRRPFSRLYTSSLFCGILCCPRLKKRLFRYSLNRAPRDLYKPILSACSCKIIEYKNISCPKVEVR